MAEPPLHMTSRGPRARTARTAGIPFLPALARRCVPLLLVAWGCAGPRAASRATPASAGLPAGALSRCDAALAAGHYGEAATQLVSALSAPGAADGGGSVRTRVLQIARLAPLPIAAAALDALSAPGRADLIAAGIQELRHRVRASPGLEADLALIGSGRDPGRARSVPDSIELRAVLPLSGAGSAYGLALASGLRSALLGSDIRLVCWDAGPDLVSTAGAAAGACGGWVPGLVTGAALSGPTAVLAAAAEARGVPLLSLSAGEERLAALGPWVASTAALRVLQGQVLATELVNSGRIHSAAVLAPEGSADDGLARGFRATASKLLKADVPLLPYRDATRIGRLAEQLRGQAPDVIVLDGDGGQVLALESQLAYYEVHTHVAGGEELRPSSLPRETLQRLEGSFFVDPVWHPVPFPARDPLDTWKQAAAALQRNSHADPDPASDPELVEAVWKGYAAGRVAVGLLTGGNFVGPHSLRHVFENQLVPIDADSTLQVLRAPEMRLEVREIADGGGRTLR